MILLSILQLHLVLFGLAAAARRWCGPLWLARLITPVAVSLVFFFLEHFVGLGSLPGLGIAAAGAAAFLLYRDRRRLRLDRDFEYGYLAVFAYTFLWRFAYPNLHGDGSERLMNLSFIVNYSRGDRLPPVDSWFPPAPFSMYYALQHYAAALLGRVLAVEPGVSYHLAFATILGLTGGAAMVFFCHFLERRWQQWLAMATLFLGGTGASLAVHFLVRNVLIADSMTFIGFTLSHRRVDSKLGEWLLEVSNVARDLPLQLPLHTPAFLIQLGDYHAPIGSMFLLAASLACMVLSEKQKSPPAAAFLGATVPLTAASNAWLLPMQGLLVAAWLAYRRWRAQSLELRAVILGGSIPAALLLPFVIPFLRSTTGVGMSLRLVPADAHTPLLLGLIQWLPLLLLLLAHLLRKDGAPLARAATLFFAACFLLVEFVYADDHYLKNWERFNSVLKWWSWIWMGLLMAATAGALGSRSKPVRVLALAGLLLPLTYVYDLARYFLQVPKPTIGRMNGAGALELDDVYRPALAYLKARPKGTVLQLVESDAYTLTPSLAMLAGQNAYIGWPEHERVWRGALPEILQRETEARQFYLGVLPNPAQWAQAHGITDVFWLPTVHTLPPDAFPTVFESMRQSPYRWKELYRNERGVYGVWSL